MSEIQWETFSVFREKISAELSQLHSTCLPEKWKCYGGKSFFRQRFLNFRVSWEPERKTCRLLPIHLQQVCDNCILLFRSIDSENCFSGRKKNYFLNFFAARENAFQIFWNSLQQSCQKSFPRPGRTFKREKWYLENCL